MIKRVSALFVLLFFICVIGRVSAADMQKTRDYEITPLWTLINRVSNNLTISSNGRADMSSSIVAYSGIERVMISAHLQRFHNNVWTTIKNWAYETNGTFAFWNDSWFVTKGYHYRLVTYFYAYKGETVESTVLVTPVQYY